MNCSARQTPLRFDYGDCFRVNPFSFLRILNPFEESALRAVRIASPNRKSGRDDCALRGALNIAHGSGKAAALVCAEGVNGFSGKVGAFEV